MIFVQHFWVNIT